jgi:predicted TIM-barrel fold metal-dependent hydrolase
MRSQDPKMFSFTPAASSRISAWPDRAGLPRHDRAPCTSPAAARIGLDRRGLRRERSGMAIALSHLMFEGTLDRFPGSKLIAAHVGGFLPSYADRSDHARMVGPKGCSPGLNSESGRVVRVRFALPLLAYFMRWDYCFAGMPDNSVRRRC